MNSLLRVLMGNHTTIDEALYQGAKEIKRISNSNRRFEVKQIHRATIIANLYTTKELK